MVILLTMVTQVMVVREVAQVDIVMEVIVVEVQVLQDKVLMVDGVDLNTSLVVVEVLVEKE
jgi:hypothetical protein